MLFQLRTYLCFFQLYLVTLCQPPQRFYIGVLFVLHDKADGIAAGAATKAFINLFARRNGERRGFFVVKRAQTQVVGAPFFKFNEGAHYFHNVYAAEDLLYGVLRYHATANIREIDEGWKSAGKGIMYVNKFKLVEGMHNFMALQAK